MYIRIKNLREDLDLKQIDIANFLHCSQRAYSHYERGDADLPTATLSRLADFHNTSVDYILGRTNERAPYPPARVLKN